MRDFNCLMLDYNVPEIKKIQSNIDKDDLYLGENEDDKSKYGLEKDNHVTLLYGIHPNVEFDELKKYLLPLEEYKTLLVNLSLFENDKYDVLKIDVKCPNLNKTNKELCDNIDFTNEYPEYHPHMTVAYLMKGCGSKYTKKMLDKIIDVTPKCFNYGVTDESNEIYYNKDLKNE